MSKNNLLSTRFVLLRHGESEANKSGILQGWYESDLNDNGRAQAQCAAEYLKEYKIDIAYTSDLSRARVTAETALQYHPEVELHPVKELREWHLGVLEGRVIAELSQEYPEAIAAFRREMSDPEIPGGERRAEFQQRIEDFMNQTALKHPGKTVLICTHGGVLQRIMRMITGDFRTTNIMPLPDNASVSSVLYMHNAGGWKLDTWNYRDHLKSLVLTDILAY